MRELGIKINYIYLARKYNCNYRIVKNAIIYDFNNGLTEEFNNKTKVIKRQMYNRCNFDLLCLNFSLIKLT